MVSRILFGALAILIGSCSASTPVKTERLAPPSEEFSRYWHRGLAEITRFDLVQARYGEERDGEAVMVFVTEDFLAAEQVKLESEPAGRAVVPVLKANITKSFTTGIYPYSMMTSIFAPVDQTAPPHALKVTTSVQEWCGQTWTQINRRGEEYHVEEHSYFEREADRTTTLDAVLLEDELWTRIRLNPSSLPLGTIEAIPSTMSARLRHIPPAVETARASLGDAGHDGMRASCADGRPARAYTLEYPASGRRLSILFAGSFPHEILGWSETYRDGGRELTTRAVRRQSTMIDYWNRNAVADSLLRRELGM